MLLGSARPDLLVWPETAYPLAFGAGRSALDDSMDQELRRYSRERKIPILFGGYRIAGGREYNSALLIDPAGRLQEYHKHILLPLGEYIPRFADWQWLRDRLPAIPHFAAGESPLVIDLPLAGGLTLAAAPIICYEALFAAHVLAGANAGADVIANLTNDAWFGSTAEKRLHLAMAALRSVETRLPQLRATNTGITALIRADGTIVNPTPPDEEATRLYDVAIVDMPPTVVARCGPWAGPVCLVAGLLLALVLLSRARLSRRGSISRPADARPLA